MKALAILAIVVATVTLATVATVAIWASIADAPWEDTDTEEASEAERVIAEVSILYRHISEGDYLAMWSVYTSAFQNRCSFEDVVAYFEKSKRSGWDTLVFQLRLK